MNTPPFEREMIKLLQIRKELLAAAMCASDSEFRALQNAFHIQAAACRDVGASEEQINSVIHNSK